MSEKESTNAPVTHHIIIILLLALVFFNAMSFFKADKALETYQYDAFFVKDSEFKTKMVQLGDSGWEIVSARRATSSRTLGGDGEAGYEFIVKKTNFK